MPDFSLTLLREKFTIRDSRGEDIPGHPVMATSNRMVVALTDARGREIENFIVRAQNMHGCARMAAKIFNTHERVGPLLNRPTPFDWDATWDGLTEEYERQFNPARWIAVYTGGKVLYASGTHHIFLDLIEKCDHDNPENYENAVQLAEKAFGKAGKQVTIEYDSNVALVLNVKKQEARCGVILRGAAKTATFNYLAETRGDGVDAHISAPNCLTVAAAFLEGIQLAYIIGSVNEKVRLGLIEQYSDEWRKAESARRRLGRLNAEIRSFENRHDVRYRPEKPEFGLIVDEAERNIREVVNARINAEADKI